MSTIMGFAIRQNNKEKNNENKKYVGRTTDSDVPINVFESSPSC